MEDLSYLDDVEVSSTLLQSIQKNVATLRELQQDMLDKEAAFKEAEDKFLRYARGDLPQMLHMNGLDSMVLDDGTKLVVATKTTCSINKNESDRAHVAEWLRQQGAGALVKTQAIVPESQIDLLKQANIIHQEEMTMNTNSVKAFVIDQLGQKGNVATITKEDIPHGLNFFQFDEVQISKVIK